MAQFLYCRQAVVLCLALHTMLAQQAVLVDPRPEPVSRFETAYKAVLPESERIAGLSLLWTEAKHHFVFFDRLPDLDWDTRYLEYLPRVRAAGTTLEYYRLLQRLCAELKDEHTLVRLPKQLAALAESVPAIQLGRIEGKVVITSVDNPALVKDDVRPGLEITAVDEVPVRQFAMVRVAPYYGDDHRTLHYLLEGSRDTPVALQLRDGGSTAFTRVIPRVRLSTDATVQMESPRFLFRRVTNTIGYVALNTFRDGEIVDEFLAAFEAIRRSDKLIIDVRNNHGGNALFSDRILACFTERSVVSEVYDLSHPPEGGAAASGVRPTPMMHTIRPDGQRLYDKPVVLLIGPHTASSAESFVVGFESLRHGAMIGQRTAGATGQPVTFSLPGGGALSVLGMRVRYASGKEFMFAGIQPDIEIQPTVTDLRAGVDTVLNAAIRYFAP